MNRAVQSATLAAALLALTGCGAMRSQPEMAAQGVSTEEFLATLPAERKQEIAAAETEVRRTEREAERAEMAIALAEERLKAARADVDARKAEVEKAQARVELVRKEHRAQLQGAPVKDQVPTDVQAAARRLADAEHAVDVARWHQEWAQSLVRLREREERYAKAFEEAARQQVGVKKAEVGLARAQVVERNRPGLVEEVVDPRVARAQASLRDAQASYAQAHAGATERLADVQLQRRVMARFDQGPPAKLETAAAPGQSGTARLAPTPQPVQLAPLPWPDPWEPKDQRAPASGGRARQQ